MQVTLVSNSSCFVSLLKTPMVLGPFKNCSETPPIFAQERGKFVIFFCSFVHAQNLQFLTSHCKNLAVGALVLFYVVFKSRLTFLCI